MAKFLVVLAVVIAVTAGEYVRISRDVGGIVDLGPGYGASLGGMGINRQISAVGTTIGHNGLGGVGVNNHVTSVGASASLGHVGHGMGGVNHIGVGPLGHHGGVVGHEHHSQLHHGHSHGHLEHGHHLHDHHDHGHLPGHVHLPGQGHLHHGGHLHPGHHPGHPGLGTVGVTKEISAVGASLGGLGGVARTSSVSSSLGGHPGIANIGALGGIGSLGGLGGLTSLGGNHGFGHLASINRLSHVSTLPGGYYGGLLAYPTSVGGHVSASQLHIPGAAVDTYKGYFGGYYPGSAGYGHSYRFFH